MSTPTNSRSKAAVQAQARAKKRRRVSAKAQTVGVRTTTTRKSGKAAQPTIGEEFTAFRTALPRRALRLFMSLCLAWLHLFLVIRVQGVLPVSAAAGGIDVRSLLITLASLAVPPILLAVIYPRSVLRRWYRWPLLWILTMSSSLSTPVLLAGDMWLLYRILYVEGPLDAPASRVRSWFLAKRSAVAAVKAAVG